MIGEHLSYSNVIARLACLQGRLIVEPRDAGGAVEERELGVDVEVREAHCRDREGTCWEGWGGDQLFTGSHEAARVPFR